MHAEIMIFLTLRPYVLFYAYRIVCTYDPENWGVEYLLLASLPAPPIDEAPLCAKTISYLSFET